MPLFSADISLRSVLLEIYQLTAPELFTLRRTINREKIEKMMLCPCVLHYQKGWAFLSISLRFRIVLPKFLRNANI